MSTRMIEKFELPLDAVDLEAAAEVKEKNDKEMIDHFNEIESDVEDENKEALELRESYEPSDIEDCLQNLWNIVAEVAEESSLAFDDNLDDALRNLEFETDSSKIEDYINTIEDWARELETSGFESAAERVNDCTSNIKDAAGLFLDEALPQDLAKAYKAKQYVIGSGYRDGDTSGYANIAYNKERPGVDFENSEYTKITPEEAKSKWKDRDVENLRIIFDNQLVTFSNDKKQTRKAARSYKSDYNLYMHNNKRVDYTTGLSFNEIVDRASAIYYANEQTISQDLISTRNSPLSKYAEIRSFDNLIGQLTRGSMEPSRGYYTEQDLAYYKKELENYNTIIKDLEDQLVNADEAARPRIQAQIDRYNHDLDYYKIKLARAEDSLALYKQSKRDRAAYIRDYTANKALREPFEKLQDIKYKMKRNDRELGQAERELSNQKNYGERARREKSIKEMKDKLRRLMLEISEAEEWLPADDEKDAVKLKAFTDKINELQSKQTDLQNELNTLLRR